MNISNAFVHGFLPCVGIVLYENDTSQLEFMIDMKNFHMHDDDIESYLGVYIANKYKYDDDKREIIMRLLTVYYRITY